MLSRFNFYQKFNSASAVPKGYESEAELNLPKTIRVSAQAQIATAESFGCSTIKLFAEFRSRHAN